MPSVDAQARLVITPSTWSFSLFTDQLPVTSRDSFLRFKSHTTMGVEPSQRTRPSLDGILDLLADLDDEQAALLLNDFDHTAHNNVPVAKAIDLFEGFPHAKRNTRVRPYNWPEKRISSAPAASGTRQFSSTAAAPDVGLRVPSHAMQHGEPPSRRDAAKQEPSLFGHVTQSFHPECSLVSPPAPDTPLSPQKRTYKRINRPELPSTTPNPLNPPDLRMLLAAYLADAPPVSPTLSSASFSSLTTLSTLDDDEDIREPCLDVLEPRRASLTLCATRGLGLGFCGEPAGNIGGIFEVLGSEEPGRGARV